MRRSLVFSSFVMFYPHLELQRISAIIISQRISRMPVSAVRKIKEEGDLK